jgi:hypothetical protein
VSALNLSPFSHYFHFQSFLKLFKILFSFDIINKPYNLVSLTFHCEWREKETIVIWEVKNLSQLHLWLVKNPFLTPPFCWIMLERLSLPYTQMGCLGNRLSRWKMYVFFSIAFNMFVKIPDLDCEIHTGLCLGGCMLVWSAIFCLSFLVCNLDMFFNLGLVWMNNLISYSLNVYHISADV